MTLKELKSWATENKNLSDNEEVAQAVIYLFEQIKLSSQLLLKSAEPFDNACIILRNIND